MLFAIILFSARLRLLICIRESFKRQKVALSFFRYQAAEAFRRGLRAYPYLYIVFLTEHGELFRNKVISGEIVYKMNL